MYALMFDSMEEATDAVNKLSENRVFLVNMKYIPDTEDRIWQEF